MAPLPEFADIAAKERAAKKAHKAALRAAAEDAAGGGESWGGGRSQAQAPAPADADRKPGAPPPPPTLDDDDDLKVFVSRLPPTWTDDGLAEHFAAVFGPVRRAVVKTDKANGLSRGFGFVVFQAAAGKDAALAQRSMHVHHKTVQIRPVERRSGGGGDGCGGGGGEGGDGVCYAWTQGVCARGDGCKFRHDGPGACVMAALPGQGKAAKCLEFRKKGRCKAGDACPFRHVAKQAAAAGGGGAASAATPVVTPADEGEGGAAARKAKRAAKVGSEGGEAASKGVCHNWKKKGKCRKGDRCPYAHAGDAGGGAAGKSSGGGGGTDGSGAKRRRIDGTALIFAKSGLVHAGSAKPAPKAAAVPIKVPKAPS